MNNMQGIKLISYTWWPDWKLLTSVRWNHIKNRGSKFITWYNRSDLEWKETLLRDISWMEIDYLIDIFNVVKLYSQTPDILKLKQTVDARIIELSPWKTKTWLVVNDWQEAVKRIL